MTREAHQARQGEAQGEENTHTQGNEGARTNLFVGSKQILRVLKQGRHLQRGDGLPEKTIVFYKDVKEPKMDATTFE